MNSRLGLWPVNRPAMATRRRAAASAAGAAEPRLQPRIVGRSRSWFATAALLLLAARPAPAQAIGQGFELERAGQHQQAVTVYFATVRADPTNLPALLGLERVLPLLGRLPELLPVAQRDVTADAIAERFADLATSLARADTGVFASRIAAARQELGAGTAEEPGERFIQLAALGLVLDDVEAVVQGKP